MVEGDFSVEDVLRAVGADAVAHGSTALRLKRVAPLHEAELSSITWVRSEHARKQELVEKSRAGLVICDNTIELAHFSLDDRCIVQVANPEVAFLRLLKNLFAPERRVLSAGIHPTAIVHAEARLGEGVTIGPYCVIGKVEIGDRVTMQNFVSVHDGVVLGRNVFLADHCTVGGQGFGHVRNERGDLENMPHLGNVILEDDVELFPHTNVDRATLSETRVCRGAKIDHYCHIGHNTRVGRGTVFAAKVVICGGVRIGDNCWIGVGTVVRDGLEVGAKAVTGLGSVVTRSIPPGEVWAGSPARPLEELKLLQEHLRRLVTS